MLQRWLKTLTIVTKIKNHNNNNNNHILTLVVQIIAFNKCKTKIIKNQKENYNKMRKNLFFSNLQNKNKRRWIMVSTNNLIKKIKLLEIKLKD